MFYKLKRKFVTINMALLTIVFAAIFSVIYMLTAIAGDRQTEFALNTVMFAPPRSFPDDPMSATSMTAELDKENNIVKTFSFMNINREVIARAVRQAYKTEALSGKIRIEEARYAFLKQETPHGAKIVFVDRTPQHRTLMNMLQIFLTVGGISLILLFGISIYFANKSIKPIQEVFEKQKQFIADASHELRTPLTVIKTNLALIAANSEATVKSQARWIEYISTQTDRMAGLVDDMLALARIDHVKMRPLFSGFDLSQVVNGILLSFEVVLFEDHITLKPCIQGEVYLNGDQEGIRKVVNILIDNAVKNTPINGIITVSLASSENKTKLRVTNTGPGIAAQDLGKIFERFYRADTARGRENGGYGLGLAIAKSIVEQHRGRIYATSKPGAETAFVVELPAGQRKGADSVKDIASGKVT